MSGERAGSNQVRLVRLQNFDQLSSPRPTISTDLFSVLHYASADEFQLHELWGKPTRRVGRVRALSELRGRSAQPRTRNARSTRCWSTQAATAPSPSASSRSWSTPAAASGGSTCRASRTTSPASLESLHGGRAESRTRSSRESLLGRRPYGAASGHTNTCHTAGRNTTGRCPDRCPESFRPRWRKGRTSGRNSRRSRTNDQRSPRRVSARQLEETSDCRRARGSRAFGDVLLASLGGRRKAERFLPSRSGSRATCRHRTQRCPWCHRRSQQSGPSCSRRSSKGRSVPGIDGNRARTFARSARPIRQLRRLVQVCGQVTPHK